MKKIFLIVFIFSFSSFSWSQDSKKLDDLFIEARDLINVDTEKSKEMAQQLLEESIKSKQPQMEVKAYYLLAFNHYLNADSKAVTNYLDKAINLSRKVGYKEGEALALRLLGTQYAKLTLLDKSNETLNEALNIIDKIEGEEANEIRGMIYNSQLILMDDVEKKKEKLVVSKNAVKEFQKLTHEKRKNDLLISALSNLGYLYTRNGFHDSAQIVLREALKRNDQKKDAYLYGSIYHDIGYAFQNQGAVDSAIANYKKGLSYISGKDFAFKRLEIYERLYKLYKEENDVENHAAYLEKYSLLNDSIHKQNAQGVETILKSSENNTQEISKENQFFKWLILLLIICIIGACIMVTYQWLERKKQRKIFEELIRSQNEQKRENSKKLEIINDTSHDSESSISILEETELRIIQDLKKFERQKQFNQSDVSLSSLANQFQTNTKYLSEIIKKHKGTNFNQYINQLRIDYIVEKLQNDPQYLQYKISHLAEETGFSSHSAFSSIFSQIMGITPSNFIKFIKEKQ